MKICFSTDDLVVRKTSRGTVLWISQRIVLHYCGISEEYLRCKARYSYKNSLPPSWARITNKKQFFLGDTGRSWRWGVRAGKYFYDYDRIPDKSPSYCRSSLPSREELISHAKNRGARETVAYRTSEKIILPEVDVRYRRDDINYYREYRIGNKHIFNDSKSHELARAAAWCRFLKEFNDKNRFSALGFQRKTMFLQMCVSLISKENLEGFHIRTISSLRKKIALCPADDGKLLEYLVSGKYCNDNSRKIGKGTVIDRATGEVFPVDYHQAVIMTYWLNPGKTAKCTKTELWSRYAEDMNLMGIKPVSQSSFNHYTNAWSNRLLSSRERHGEGICSKLFRPYTPSRRLEFANSLWACDGSGIVPYRYTDKKGKIRTMKLYVMLVSDTASRYIAGYAVSRKASHSEDFRMMSEAVKMALRRNGKTEVLDFISDNHGAFTSAESKQFLAKAFRNCRTISPGNSKANPAETIFRLFKRRFKGFFKMAETSWDARSLESVANPDYYTPEELPTYEQAISKLEEAVRVWNSTALSNGITPEQWFDSRKNPEAGLYPERLYRMLTGEKSFKDLSYSRGTMLLERDGCQYRYEVPTDTDSIALISSQMGYSPYFKATIYWDREAADVYTADGRFIFSCPPSSLAAKSHTEADHESISALAHHSRKQEDFDRMINDYEKDLRNAVTVIARDYCFSIGDKDTKENYNGMMEATAETSNRKTQTTSLREKDSVWDSAPEARQVNFHKRRISNLSKYTDL